MENEEDEEDDSKVVCVIKQLKTLLSVDGLFRCVIQILNLQAHGHSKSLPPFVLTDNLLQHVEQPHMGPGGCKKEEEDKSDDGSCPPSQQPHQLKDWVLCGRCWNSG